MKTTNQRLRVLVACEESQAVCIEFRKLGHYAISVDLLESSGGHPEWHIQNDVLKVIGSSKWDILIGFPPCTYLSSVQLFRMKNNVSRQLEMIAAKDFFMKLWNCGIHKIAIENPTGTMNTTWRQATQIIHPWYFGDPEMKRTCLWLKNLPKLNGIHAVALNRRNYKPKPRRTFINAKGQTKNIYFANDPKNIGDSTARSKTFPGIARAMAEQWGGQYIENLTPNL